MGEDRSLSVTPISFFLLHLETKHRTKTCGTLGCCSPFRQSVSLPAGRRTPCKSWEFWGKHLLWGKPESGGSLVRLPDRAPGEAQRRSLSHPHPPHAGYYSLPIPPSAIDPSPPPTHPLHSFAAWFFPRLEPSQSVAPPCPCLLCTPGNPRCPLPATKPGLCPFPILPRVHPLSAS